MWWIRRSFSPEKAEIHTRSLRVEPALNRLVESLSFTRQEAELEATVVFPSPVLRNN